MDDPARRAIKRVVDGGNCSGCGMCAALAPGVTMAIDADGYARPQFSAEADLGLDVVAFRSYCPGVRMAPPAGALHHDKVFGRYVSVWQGRAADDTLRHHGGSAGVISAMSAWLLATGQAPKITGAAPSATHPGTTAPMDVRNSADLTRIAGSRYAPVAMAEVAPVGNRELPFVGKPCEVAAFVRSGDEMAESPGLRMSFFCAGTPSQRATDRLVAEQGDGVQVLTVKYRGEGWPGDFRATFADGSEARVSYADSWRDHLGSSIQWRCKVCPDGTGEFADIAVGDYWQSDAQGFPILDDRPANSVVIARSQRGHDALLQAERDGFLNLEPVDLASVGSVQPLQVLRRATLAGRLIGAMLAGRRVPRVVGYGAIRSAVKNPRRFARALAGTWLRLRRGRTGSL